MSVVWLLALTMFCNELSLNGVSTNVSTVPDVVHVGVVFSFDTTTGKVSKIAVEAAVEDVNSSPDILPGTKLNITMQNSNYSGFLAFAEVLQFMERDTVAIIGPQSSTTAHIVSPIANELHVPFLSFSATDPTLSSLQFPFFVMTTQNDLFELSAIVDIVEHYEWREVVAIYGDNEHGRNGIAVLGDKLAQKRCKISYRAPLRLGATRDEMTEMLVEVALTESRVVLVHTAGDWALELFSVAQHLGMMGNGYVWIASHWLSIVLDTWSPLPQATSDNLQGLLTLRMYTPDSALKQKIVSRWSNMTREKAANEVPIGLSTHGLYAYDTVWLLAHAIDQFLKQGGQISFSNDAKLSKLQGQVKFTPDRNLINPAYEVINVIGNGYRRIGFWSNHSGLSLVPPEMCYTKASNHSSSSQKLHSVIWPGQTTQKPRGWVFPNNGRKLRIGVPRRVSFREFISVKSNEMITGYCIDVFTAALNLLPYAVPYQFVPYGDGFNNPSNTELVRLITAGEYDAAVGDIAIITNRTKMVDFTQPYIESGLVVVAPVEKRNSNAWAFLRPFRLSMWLVTASFFLIVGLVVWILEHRLNNDFRGPPRRQVVTVLWFSFSTLFFAHREKTISWLARIVLIIWLFVVLIINSSYTASLTSILTVQQLSSPINGIQSLISSNDPIGYPQGSFAWNYLTDELQIHESRLIPLHSPDEYATALKDGPSKGGVAAVVDERAFIELFLSTRCEFSIVGKEFTKNGWGFAFPLDSPLAIDMSTAILKLSENGDLQRMHDKWLLRSACSLQGTELEVDRLQLKSFWGLFLMCGLACLLALLVYSIQIIWKFSRHHPQELVSSSVRTSARIQTFLSFADEKEEVIHRNKRRHIEKTINTVAKVHSKKEIQQIRL